MKRNVHIHVHDATIKAPPPKVAHQGTSEQARKIAEQLRTKDVESQWRVIFSHGTNNRDTVIVKANSEAGAEQAAARMGITRAQIKSIQHIGPTQDAERRKDFEGHVVTRAFHGYNLLEGAGRFGGMWGLKEPNMDPFVFGSRAEAESHAKNNPRD